ncbi:MAG: InlB B-repeat-containing protein [Lachnospiraceae bacterium]|nr:InlB B-repeat-containing protein [Lachnospiraceae bacterium]
MKQKRQKTGRKFLSFLLALAMVVGLMPGMSLTAMADDVDLYVGNQPVTGTQSSGDGTWDYNADTKTLTLNGYNNNGAVQKVGYQGNYYCIYSNVSLNIILKGENTLTGSDGRIFGIYVSGGNNNLTISGDGSLNISVVLTAIGCQYGDVTISGATVSADSTNAYCIASGGNAGNKVTIQDAIVTTNAFGNSAIWSMDSVTIENSTVNVTSESGGIYSGNGVTIESSECNVDATGNWSTGITSVNGNIEIIGDKVTVFGGQMAIMGSLENAIAGTGWTDTGTEVLEVGTHGSQDIMGYKKMQFPTAHNHDFTYTAAGATITATCLADGCALDDGSGKHTAKLTIVPSESGGNTAKLTGDTGEFGVTDDVIKYQKKNSNGWQNSDVPGENDTGFYKASVTLTGSDNQSATAEVIYGVSMIKKGTGDGNGCSFDVPKVAIVGTKIKPTLALATGYKVKKITVKDEDGKDVSDTVGVDNEGFTMPDYDVTVDVEFEGMPVNATLNVVGGSGTTCAAKLLDDNFTAVTGSSVNKKAGERFVLSISMDDEYDYSIGFDPYSEVSSYVEEFSEDDYGKYVAYARANNISNLLSTDLFWITMPGVAEGELNINVTFAKVKSFTILYRSASSAEAVWCKFTKQAGGTEIPFAVDMKQDAVMGDQVVWAAKVTAAFAPKEIAFATTTDLLKNASMTDVTVKQSIQNESDWTNIGVNGGKFVVISGNVKVIVAAFVTDPSSMVFYDSETVTFDVPESSAGVNHVITVCGTDNEGKVTSAGTLTALAEPTGDVVPKGKEFAGWRGFYFEDLNSKVIDKVYNAGETINVCENTTFHAVWQPKTLTVKLNLNGGAGGSDVTSVTYGQTLPFTKDPTKDGYEFGGWTVDKAVTENDVYYGRGSAFDVDTPITDNIELTAQWKHIHSYTYCKISDFGDVLHDYLSYESKLHIKICGDDDLAFEAHSFDSSGKCSCGYQKLTETVTLKITYGKWDGTTYTPKMAEADRKVVKGQETSVYAPSSLGSDMKFSKWQYSADGTTWKDLASYAMMGFVVPANMQLRALYTNPVTKPQISLSATTYPVMVEGYELNTILLQMAYQLPDGYYYVDSGVKASDNIGISYYELKEIKKTAGQKAALAGIQLGLSFLPGAGIGDFLVGQTMDAMNGPEYYYEKREDSVLGIMTAETLSDFMYKGKPVNIEKFDPLYWDYRPDTKSQSGSLNAQVPLNFVQKNNWNHYIYGIAWLRYKDKAGKVQTIYTPALATTLTDIANSKTVTKSGL